MARKLYSIILGCCVLFLLPTIAFSGDFITNKQTMFTPDKKEIGYINKGAEVEKKNDNLSITGWVMDGNEYIIFYSNTARIRLARIDKIYIKDMTILKTIKDEYDVTWKQVSLEFTLDDNTKISSSRATLWDKETKLYQRCGSCHTNFPPHEFTPNQWPQLIKTMKSNAGLTNDDVKQLGVYLQYQSIKEY
jgi:hypothetical protein